MKKLITSIFVFLIFLNIVSALEIKGIVIDADTKESIPGANVVIKQNGNSITGTTTSIEGSFQINVPSGNYNIEISNIAYQNTIVAAENKALTIELRENTLELEETIITAEGYRHLIGKVTDQNGNSIGDVSIRISKDSFSDSTTSTNTGTYSFSFLERGTYSLTFSKQGIESKTIQIELEGSIGEYQEINTEVNKLYDEPTQEEQTMVVGKCSGNYDILVLENGALLTGRNDIWSSNYYEGNSYLFNQPSSRLAILNGRANILLYRNNLQNKCGEKIVEVVGGKCTNYVFNIRNKGPITFQICPETSSTGTGTEQPITIDFEERPLLIPECEEDNDCNDENKPVCYYGECISEDFNDLTCKDMNKDNKLTPSDLSTEEEWMIENPEQKMGGGKCYILNTVKEDYCKDPSTLVYFSCSDNCGNEKEYTCPNGCENNKCVQPTISNNPTFTVSELLEKSLCVGEFEYNGELYSLDDYDTFTEAGFRDGEQLYEIPIDGTTSVTSTSSEDYLLTTSVSTGKSCTYTLNSNCKALGGNKVILQINGNQLTIYRDSPGEDTFVLACEDEVGEVLVEDLDSFGFAGAVTATLSTCSENPYTKMANLPQPFWRWGDRTTRTFLDEITASKLMKKENYGIVQNRIRTNGVEYIDGDYRTSTGKTITKLKVPKETVSEMVGINQELFYYQIEIASTYYINSNSDVIVKLKPGLYLIPDTYDSRVEISQKNFDEIINQYNEIARTTAPKSGRISEDPEVILENVNFLNIRQRGTIETIPEEAVSYRSHYLLKVKNGNWYAVPFYEVKEPGIKNQKRNWNWDLEKMREIHSVLHPEKTWAERKLANTAEYVSGLTDDTIRFFKPLRDLFNLIF